MVGCHTSNSVSGFVYYFCDSSLFTTPSPFLLTAVRFPRPLDWMRLDRRRGNTHGAPKSSTVGMIVVVVGPINRLGQLSLLELLYLSPSSFVHCCHCYFSTIYLEKSSSCTKIVPSCSSLLLLFELPFQIGRTTGCWLLSLKTQADSLVPGREFKSRAERLFLFGYALREEGRRKVLLLLTSLSLKTKETQLSSHKH